MKFKFFTKKMLFLMLGDVIAISCAYFLSHLLRFGSVERHNTTALTITIAAFVLMLYLIDFYNADLKFGRVHYLFRHLAGVAVVVGLLAMGIYLFQAPNVGRAFFLLDSVLAGAATYFWRLAFQSIFKKRLTSRQNLLIIGGGRSGEALDQILKKNSDYHLVGSITEEGHPLQQSAHSHTHGGPEMLRKMVKALRVNVLVLATSQFRNPELLKAALHCKLDGVFVTDMPSFYENVTGKVPVEHVTDFWFVFTPLLGVKKNIYNTKLKRGLDIVLSSLGLVLSLPLTLTAAAAVCLDSQGRALYRQKRIGLDGKPFTLLKFRSMHDGTENDRKHAGERHDPRITRVGRVLRRTRIDELPQLWNVLRGDMSFIGPRALMQEEVKDFEQQIPYFSLRHSIRPGITGWAQINYKHGARVEDGLEKLQFDLFYIKNLSPLLDSIILMKTFKVVLSGKGAR